MKSLWLLLCLIVVSLVYHAQAKKFMYKNEADYQKGLLLQKKIVKMIKSMARQEEVTSKTVNAVVPSALLPYYQYVVREKRDAQEQQRQQKEEEKRKSGRKLLDSVPAHLRHFVEGEAAYYVDEETLNSIDFNNEDAVKELKEFVAEQQSKNARYEFGYVVKVLHYIFYSFKYSILSLIHI